MGLLVATGLVGATVSYVRSCESPKPPAATFSSESFREAVLRLDDSTLSESRRDSLMAVLMGDSVEPAVWRRQADSLAGLLIANAPPDAVRDLVQRIDDDPVTIVNINEAGPELLASLPGIGPKLAQRIVEYRNQNGPFRTIGDLRRVKGIGKKMFEKIKPFVDIK